jgi:hypothetical protein
VVSMESTAQYWRSVWLELEPHMLLHLAHAFSNRAPRGRKHGFRDAERLVRRLIADELILSFVPNGAYLAQPNADEDATHSRPGLLQCGKVFVCAKSKIEEQTQELTG